MKEIVLNFTKCKKAKSTDELYEVIKKAFQYPFDYGNNPDALWDAMWHMWKDDVHLKIYGVNDLEYLYLQIEMEYIIDVFRDVHNETPNVTFEIIS